MNFMWDRYNKELQIEIQKLKTLKSTTVQEFLNMIKQRSHHRLRLNIQDGSHLKGQILGQDNQILVEMVLVFLG